MELQSDSLAVGGMSLLLEIAPTGDRALYVGLANSVLGVALLLTSVGGLLVDWLGYRGVFLLAAGCGGQTTDTCVMKVDIRTRESSSAAFSSKKCSLAMSFPPRIRKTSAQASPSATIEAPWVRRRGRPSRWPTRSISAGGAHAVLTS